MDREIKDFLESEWMTGLRARFAFVDTNGDGFVNADDIGVALATAGLPVTPAWAARVLARFDGDRDGRVSVTDYVVGLTVSGWEQQPLARALHDAFHAVDGDSDGRVSADEMRAWYHGRGVMLSPAEVADRLRPWDTDGDGRIDFREFVRMIVA